MATQQLWFESSDGSTLFETEGSTVTQLADSSSSPAFLADPIYGTVSVTYVGSTAYIIMADTTGGTSAIWQYSGTTLKQITASSNYVSNQQDSNDPSASLPFVSYNNDLIFSQASLASNVAGDGNNDTTTLAVYNPTTGAITQPVAPNGGYDPHDFVTIGSTLYFEARDSGTGETAIYSYNGTTVTEIYNLDPINSGNKAAAVGAVAGSLVAFNGNLYFGSGNQSVEELTSTGSMSNEATNVTPNQTLANSFGSGSGFIVSGGDLYFDSGNSGVFAINDDNQVTTVLADAPFFFPVVDGGTVYFTTAINGGAFNLYSTTGGAATLVKAGVGGNDFVAMGGTLYYDNNGSTLGTFNGSTFGTLSVPNGAGGVPLTVAPIDATSWTAAADPATLVAGATATYHSGGPAVKLDPGLQLSDSSSSTLTSAAIVIASSDFLDGDTLNFTNQNGIAGSYNASSGVLTLTGTASVADYKAALESITYSFADGDSTNDGANPSRTISWGVSDGLNNSLAATSTLGTLCFLDGTMIATPDGEIEVERLAAGNKVLTASGTVRTVTWAGAGRVLVTRGRRGPATPVVVRKGALADNVPHTDMRVTKGHALFLDGVLVPVEFLINHRSILWDDHAQEVSLRHIELQAHDVLLANGAPAESYRDDGNRWLFQNANDGWGLPPQEPCAPVLTGGETVDRIWRRLLDRAGPHKPPPLTDDADLHLLVDGLRVDAWRRQGPMHMFRLPGAAACVQIVSRDAVPAELGLARDFRSLGVALRWIELSQGPRVMQIEANDPRLAEGFHRYESDGDLRWTNGDARLPAELFKGFSRAVEVMIYVAASTQYPLLPPTRAVA
jgi:Hint domain